MLAPEIWRVGLRNAFADGLRGERCVQRNLLSVTKDGFRQQCPQAISMQEKEGAKAKRVERATLARCSLRLALLTTRANYDLREPSAANGEMLGTSSIRPAGRRGGN